MINYNDLKTNPKNFLAATGLKIDEFEQLKKRIQGSIRKSIWRKHNKGRKRKKKKQRRRDKRATRKRRR